MISADAIASLITDCIGLMSTLPYLSPVTWEESQRFTASPESSAPAILPGIALRSSHRRMLHKESRESFKESPPPLPPLLPKQTNRKKENNKKEKRKEQKRIKKHDSIRHPESIIRIRNPNQTNKQE